MGGGGRWLARNLRSDGFSREGILFIKVETIAVYIFSTIAITSAGFFVISHVSGSRSAVRFCVLGVCVEEMRADAVFRIDLSASLGFFTNIVKRVDP